MLIHKAQSSPPLSKKNPFTFSVDYLHEHLPEEYRPSISREIRQLKVLGVLKYKLHGKKVEGLYKLQLGKKLNEYREEVEIKYTRKQVIIALEESLKRLDCRSNISFNEEVKQMLNGKKP